MIASFLTVGQQVLELFIILAIGFVLGKTNLVTDEGNRVLSNVVLYVVSPCMLISAFQRDLVLSDLSNFAICFGLAIVIQVGSIFVAKLTIRNKDPFTKDVLQFSAIFSNCGYMAYPLQTALLGTIGVFLGSAYVAVFYLLVWTYGIYLMSKDKSLLKAKPILTNPGFLGVIVALVLYLASISLPEIILTPINYLASLNTPLPMIIIGYQLSKANIKSVLKEKASYIAAAVRLIIIPLIAIALCLILRLDLTLTTAIAIAASTPPGTIIGMFCAMLKKDSSFASSLLSAETVISIITMPLMVGLARYLCMLVILS